MKINMVELELLLTFRILVLVVSSTVGNNETVTMKHQLKELKETVSDLQKHILAQEQKQTAVLSSVLSQLTETAEELIELKHNYTGEISKLQADYTVLENQVAFMKGNSTALDGLDLSGQGVAFQAAMAMNAEPGHNIQFPADTALKFPATQYNEGGCWDPSSSVFTATVNGTYLFWINLSFTGVKTFTVSIEKNDQDISTAFGFLLDPKTMSSEISLTSVTQLVEGDRIYFVARKHAKYWPNVSSCGGVLLHSSAAH